MTDTNPKVVITRRLPNAVLEPLAAATELHVPPHDRPLTIGELHQLVPGAAAIITTLNDRIDQEVLAAAGPTLRIVANIAAGYDNLDLAAITSHGAIATNTPNVLVDATADLTLALILDITRRVTEGDRLVRSGQAWQWDIGFMLGASIQRRRLGIIGMGAIGQSVANRASSIGMEVVHHTRKGPNTLGPSRRIEFEELLTTADVITLHCPLTPETHHLIDADALQIMKPSAYLINTARGPLVDEAALAQALHRRQIAGAALDVYEHEPRIHPDLTKLENVVLTPHLGSATVETRTRMAALAVDNVLAVLRGAKPYTPISF
jgi:glyoxylate reductase